MAKKATTGEQLALGISTAHRMGRVERATLSALRAAGDDGLVDRRLDTATMTLARSMAEAVDVAATKRDPYAWATASRELREVLTRLKLDPTSRTGGTIDALAELLTSMQTTGHTPT